MDSSQRPQSAQPLQTIQDAVAGVIPADVQEWTVRLDGILARLDAERDISLALASLDPESGEELLERVLAQARAGQPLPPFTSAMSDANFWADMASPGELKAYCLACYARMPPSDQQAFLALIACERAGA